MDRALIERAIASAKARIYKLTDDEKKNPSAGHQKKIERQKEVMEVTVEALEKYAEYKDAEEQGLLLRLPCPLGAPVYYVQNCLAPNCKECGGFVRVDNCYTEHKSRIFEQEFGYRHLEAFGKCVFLTKEEAEAALEKLKGEEHETD